jgi:hypothetical protein
MKIKINSTEAKSVEQHQLVKKLKGAEALLLLIYNIFAYQKARPAVL